MNNKKYILCYGSLRSQGPKEKVYNFNRFGGQKYLNTLSLKGYDLFNLGAYPCICQGEGSITVEIHEIEENAFALVQRMESGAGYQEELVKINHNNQEIEASIFYWPKDKISSKTLQNKIDSGDWCSYQIRN